MWIVSFPCLHVSCPLHPVAPSLRSYEVCFIDSCFSSGYSTQSIASTESIFGTGASVCWVLSLHATQRISLTDVESGWTPSGSKLCSEQLIVWLVLWSYSWLLCSRPLYDSSVLQTFSQHGCSAWLLQLAALTRCVIKLPYAPS